MSLNCPSCFSDAYRYEEGDERYLCPACGFRPDYYGKPIYDDLLSDESPRIEVKPEKIDPRFGKLLASEGAMWIGDKVVPIHDIRIVHYNPDGDPTESYDANKKPNITDGEE